jgi:hypothetical protein
LTQHIEIDFGAVDDYFTKTEVVSAGSNSYTWKGYLNSNLYQMRDSDNQYIQPSSIYNMRLIHSGQPISRYQQFKFVDIRQIRVNVPSNPRIYGGSCSYNFSFRRVTGVSGDAV